MSKKHFIALARALHAARPDGYDVPTMSQWKRDVKAVAAVCADLNGQFDHSRFLEACGYGD